MSSRDATKSHCKVEDGPGGNSLTSSIEVGTRKRSAGKKGETSDKPPTAPGSKGRWDGPRGD